MINEATLNNPQPDNDYQCHHVFPDDHRCGSPRMRNEQFCYYHHDSRRPVVRPHERLARRSTFSLFTPADFDAIQESLGELLIRIAANDIDPRRARLLLDCLRISSTNLRTRRRAAQQTQLPSEPTTQPTDESEPSPTPDRRPTHQGYNCALPEYQNSRRRRPLSRINDPKGEYRRVDDIASLIDDCRLEYQAD